MQKNYLLDKSVLLYSPYSVFAFDDNHIFITSETIREMEKAALTGSGEVRANAREFGIIMDDLSRDGSLSDGVLLQNGGTLKVLNTSGYDLIDVCENLDVEQGVKATIVTRNAFQRVEASLAGIRAEPYKSESVTTNGDAYEGRCCLYLSADEMRFFAKTGYLELDTTKEYYATKHDGTALPSGYKPSVNEHIIMIPADNPSGGTMLGLYDGKRIHALRYYKDKSAKPVFGVSAWNVGQVFALDALLAPASEAPLVILKGPAGTAKTFLSVAAALAQTIDQYHGGENTYRKILLSRPNVKMDDDVGYLKGDEVSKVMPALRGLTDNIDNLMADDKKGSEGSGTLEYLMTKKVIDLQAMAYMRGRSIGRQYIIIDETQNATIMQILSLITRVGKDTKIVILGDPDQIDHPYLDSRTNGLCYASEKMRGSKLCRQITFTEDECTRSELASEAIARLTPKGAL